MMINQKEDENPVNNKKGNVFTLSMLLSAADTTDKILMALGTVGAACFGASFPLFHVLIGNVINEVDDGNFSNLQKRVNELCLIYVYIGIASTLGGFLQVCCWTYAGEHQSQKLQDQYIRAVLSQDISWFDAMGRRRLGGKASETIDVLRGKESFLSDNYIIL
jgi:ATP-binding cassette subfamily B (MDR/TAP) protein 1